MKFVDKIIEILNNLFIKPDNLYMDLYRRYKYDFNDAIIFWAFLISIHTNCWEEAIKILECHRTFDILSDEF